MGDFASKYKSQTAAAIVAAGPQKPVNQTNHPVKPKDIIFTRCHRILQEDIPDLLQNDSEPYVFENESDPYNPKTICGLIREIDKALEFIGEFNAVEGVNYAGLMIRQALSSNMYRNWGSTERSKVEGSFARSTHQLSNFRVGILNVVLGQLTALAKRTPDSTPNFIGSLFNDCELTAVLRLKDEAGCLLQEDAATLLLHCLPWLYDQLSTAPTPELKLSRRRILSALKKYQKVAPAADCWQHPNAVLLTQQKANPQPTRPRRRSNTPTAPKPIMTVGDGTES